MPIIKKRKLSKPFKDYGEYLSLEFYRYAFLSIRFEMEGHSSRDAVDLAYQMLDDNRISVKAIGERLPSLYRDWEYEKE